MGDYLIIVKYSRISHLNVYYNDLALATTHMTILARKKLKYEFKIMK